MTYAAIIDLAALIGIYDTLSADNQARSGWRRRASRALGPVDPHRQAGSGISVTLQPTGRRLTGPVARSPA